MNDDLDKVRAELLQSLMQKYHLELSLEAARKRTEALIQQLAVLERLATKASPGV
jgi:hypothetical protein